MALNQLTAASMPQNSPIYSPAELGFDPACLPALFGACRTPSRGVSSSSTTLTLTNSFRQLADETAVYTPMSPPPATMSPPPEPSPMPSMDDNARLANTLFAKDDEEISIIESPSVAKPIISSFKRKMSQSSSSASSSASSSSSSSSESAAPMIPRMSEEPTGFDFTMPKDFFENRPTFPAWISQEKAYHEGLNDYKRRRKETAPVFLNEEQFHDEYLSWKSQMRECREDTDYMRREHPDAHGIALWMVLREQSLKNIASAVEMYRISRYYEAAYTAQMEQNHWNEEFVENLQDEYDALEGQSMRYAKRMVGRNLKMNEEAWTKIHELEMKIKSLEEEKEKSALSAISSSSTAANIAESSSSSSSSSSTSPSLIIRRTIRISGSLSNSKEKLD